jgi:hypothetical protein
MGVAQPMASLVVLPVDDQAVVDRDTGERRQDPGEEGSARDAPAN